MSAGQDDVDEVAAERIKYLLGKATPDDLDSIADRLDAWPSGDIEGIEDMPSGLRQLAERLRADGRATLGVTLV